MVQSPSIELFRPNNEVDPFHKTYMLKQRRSVAFNKDATSNKAVVFFHMLQS